MSSWRACVLIVFACAACVARAAEPDDDPFRALENLQDAGTQSYLRAQASAAREALDRIPGRATLAARIRELSAGEVKVSALALAGKRVFYVRSDAAHGAPELCVREGFAGAERVLVDPRLAPDGGADASLAWFVPSPDGSHVAYALTRGGGVDAVLHVISLEAGRELPIAIDRARMNHRLAWAADSRSFYYVRIPEDNPPDRRDANPRVYRHQLGRDAKADEVVFAPGVGGARGVPEMDQPFLLVPADSRYAFAIARDGHARTVAVHVALQKELAAARPRWHELVTAADGVLAADASRDDLYLLSNRGARNRRVLRIAAKSESLDAAKVVVPEGDAVIESFALARDAIYLRTMVAGVDRLERVKLGFFGPGEREFLRTPFDTSIAELVADPQRAGAVLRLDAWIQNPAVVEVDARSGDLRDTKLQPPPAADFSGMDEVRLYATAADGTRIPVTLLYRKGTRLSRDNPTLLVGYGAYGDLAPPRFDARRLAWLERGGVFAVAHVRGGGEYGDAWHEAGQGARKATTVGDFIAACEFVSRYGFTSGNRLAIEGEGAGGLAVGGALMRRPDLFAAVVARAPLADLVRLEASGAGRADLPEFGAAGDPREREALAEASPYRRVRAGMPYPALLVLAGLNDPDVDAWHAAKLAARVQRATSSGKPVLLGFDMSSGAEEAMAREQRDQETSDVYSFALWQLGEPGFQPGPPVPPTAPAR